MRALNTPPHNTQATALLLLRRRASHNTQHPTQHNTSNATVATTPKN